MTLDHGVGRGKRPKPALETGGDFIGLTAAELETGPRAGAIFGQREVGEERVDRCAGDDWRLHERTSGIGDAIDASVDVVAHRVAGAVLHMADEGVMPVGDVERTIRRELHGDRPEIAVGRLQEVLTEGQAEAGAILAHGVLLGTEEADGVVDQDVALDVIREMAAADELEAGGGTHHLGLGHEILRQGGELAEGDLQGRRREPADVRIRSIGEEVLAIGVEGHAPRIRDAQASGALKLTLLRGITEPAAVGAALDAIRGLDVAMEEGAFAHVERAGRIGLESMDRVVGVMVVETAEDDVGLVGDTIAVGIAQEHEVAALREIDAFGRELKGQR